MSRGSVLRELLSSLCDHIGQYTPDMGLSMSFMRIQPDKIVDANRTGIAQYLEARGLKVPAGQDSNGIVTLDERPLTFDGYWSDLRLDPLDKNGPLIGHISHATLTPEECEFIYGLCVAAGFLIINHPGNPLYVVPHHNHTPDDLPEHDELYDVAWVDNSVELSRALSGEMDAFREYRSRGLSEEPRPGSPR